MSQSSAEGWLEEIWSRVAVAPRRPRDPWRTPTISTVAQNGEPESRVVVLRGVDKPRKTLEVHTDTASAKWRALKSTPKLAFCFWDPRKRIQVRMFGSTCLAEGDTAIRRWETLNPNSRKTYCLQPFPGRPIRSPDQITYEGEPRFGIITCTIVKVDVLALSHPVHQRVLASHGDNGWEVRWVSP